MKPMAILTGHNSDSSHSAATGETVPAAEEPLVGNTHICNTGKYALCRREKYSCHLQNGFCLSSYLVQFVGMI